MEGNLYELHVHNDPEFPIIFHFDQPWQNQHSLMHWHENPEFLYFTEGIGKVACDTASVIAEQGDLVIVNSCALHSICSLTPSCSYYCLIVDRQFCEQFDLAIGETMLRNLVKDAAVRLHFCRIAEEMTAKAPYYKTAVKAEILALLTRLFRTAAEQDSLSISTRNSSQIQMVRDAISYIRQHFREPLAIDDICSHIGFSKYYFCREFHKITGKTVGDYVNFMRCEHARKLLASGKNVSESAEQSGFHNQSYFSKTYKRHMGALPSVHNSAT